MEPLSINQATIVALMPTDVLAQIFDECEYLSQVVFGHVCKLFRDVSIATKHAAFWNKVPMGDVEIYCPCSICRDQIVAWPFAGPEPYELAAHSEKSDTLPIYRLVCERAAEQNNLDLLKWSVDVGYHPADGGAEICDWAAYNGSISMLEWATARGYTWARSAIIYAVEQNQTASFLWLVENSGDNEIYFEFDIVKPAITHGNLEILMRAYAAGYQFGSHHYNWPLDSPAVYTKECWELMLKMGYGVWMILRKIMYENRVNDLIWLHTKYPANIDKAICAEHNLALYCQKPTSIDVLNWILDRNYPGVMGEMLYHAASSYKFVANVINARLAAGAVPPEAMVMRRLWCASSVRDYTWD